SAHEQFKLFC
ncbi:Ion transport peptide-like, partial [Araneus ventricosus]